MDQIGNSQDPAELLAKARVGDVAAWAALCQRHAPRLAAYLGARLHRPAVVERLIADSVVLAWQRLAEVEDPSQLSAWFRRIGAALALRWHQENPQEKLREPFPESLCSSPDQVQRMRHLQDALRALSEPERMALDQHFRAGLSGTELAEVMHCDLDSAQALLERALAALERSLPLP